MTPYFKMFLFVSNLLYSQEQSTDAFNYLQFLYLVCLYPASSQRILISSPESQQSALRIFPFVTEGCNNLFEDLRFALQQNSNSIVYKYNAHLVIYITFHIYTYVVYWMRPSREQYKRQTTKCTSMTCNSRPG